MFAQKFLAGSLGFALVLVAGTAFADGPARGGYRNSVMTDVCASTAVSGAGYRDSVARQATQKDVRTVGRGSSGYRDAYARAPSRAQARQVALATGITCTH